MPITAPSVRYIKLGRGGGWEAISLERGELHFGHGKITHEMALAGDREQMKQHRIRQGRDARAAAEDAREVLDFYHLGPDCLWITFAQDRLWWTFAEPEVHWLGGGGVNHGERMRKAIGGWRSTDINGIPIRIDSLSTKLTKVASYRRTICAVEAEEYLLRRINGIAEPLVAKANQARDALLDVVTEAITSLHWQDFETMVDVIFARSGWHRASAIGGKQKLVDLVLEQPTTAERGAVQVKSSADQKTLDAFISRADEAGLFDRLFFVCHTPKGKLTAPIDRADTHIWFGRELAKTALRLGLSDWIFERVS
jgi:Restriction endonuclease